MTTQLRNVEKFLAEHKKNKELWIKLNGMTTFIVDSVVAEMSPVKNKYKNPQVLDNDIVKAIIEEQGFAYIKGVMDTITGFEFQTMLYFVDLIGNLKGTKKGLELVMRLMGFDSILKEWWQNDLIPQEPWSYDIVVIMDTTYITDVYTTIDKLRIFSDNYVLAQISNIDIRFSASRFAQVAPIVAGFYKQTFGGRIIQRVS